MSRMTLSRLQLKTSLHLLVGLGAVLLLAGCWMTGVPEPELNYLTGGNDVIAEAIRLAAEDWARHGLEIAKYVTIDDGLSGIPVRYASNAEIEQYRTPGAPPVILAATRHENGDWLFILLHERLRGHFKETVQAIRHELIHVLVPQAPHHDGIGIFTALRSSFDITRADMAHLAQYTTVTPSEVPFAEDIAA